MGDRIVVQISHPGMEGGKQLKNELVILLKRKDLCFGYEKLE